MTKPREHLLQIGDRVIIRTSYRGCADGGDPCMGRIVEIADGRAEVDCGGKLINRAVGQVEYAPTEAEISRAAAELKRAAIARLVATH